jgi:hypothetical protein
LNAFPDIEQVFTTPAVNRGGWYNQGVHQSDDDNYPKPNTIDHKSLEKELDSLATLDGGLKTEVAVGSHRCISACEDGQHYEKPGHVSVE